MIKTIIILIVTIIVVPVFSFFFGEPLSPHQHRILMGCIYICAGTAFLCWSISELSRNFSQVDKIWSVIPAVYAWYATINSDMNERMVLMSVLITIWAVRLTYNFSRRGGYSWKFWTGDEDYRWEVLRKKPELNTKTKWFLFNLFFISIYQNVLLMLITLPIVVAYAGSDNPLGWADYLLAALFVGFVVIETVADQQQWNFQKEKYRRKQAGEPLDGIYAQGFVHTGLWKIMRHPNYMSEQAVWVVIYFFSVAATGQWFNWSIAGALLLLMLFQGSSDFSEAISSEKYAGYKDYRKRTGRFIPKFW